MKMKIDNDDYWNGFLYGSVVGIFAGIGIFYVLFNYL